MSADHVDFFFDPMCPWAYQASRWIRSVRDATGIEIGWRFLSLEEINRAEGKKHPWEREWSYGWSQMRVGAWLRRESTEAVDRWYAAVGEAFHLRGVKTHDPDIHRALVADLGFPGAVDAALADPATADDVRADHDEAVGRYAAFGVPTIVLPGDVAVYGPAVTPAPTGDEALRLWQLVLGWRDLPHLYEIKRPKRRDDLEHIARQFDPYLDARDWETVEKPAP